MTPSPMDSSAVARSSAAPPEYRRPVIVFGAVTGTPRGPNTRGDGVRLGPVELGYRRRRRRRPRRRPRGVGRRRPVPCRSRAAGQARRPGPGAGSKVAPYPAISPVYRPVAPAAGRVSILKYEYRAALAWHAAACLGIEREVRAGGSARWLMRPPASCATQPHGHRRAVYRAADHHLPAARAYVAPGLCDRVKAAGLLGDEHAAWSAHAVADGDLAGVDRVEPGE